VDWWLVRDQMQIENLNSIHKLRSIQNTFNDIAAEFDVTRYKPWPHTMEFVKELPKNGLILDLGCGNGRNMVYLASVRRGFKILGLDFSNRMLKIANEKAKQQKFDKNMELILGDVFKLPLASSTLDGALFVAALHHLPSAELRLESLLELKRCLKIGGKAFISAWDFEQKRFAIELSRQLKTPPTDCEFGDVYVPWIGKRSREVQRFYHLFYRDELEKLLKKTKLGILNIFRVSNNYHAVVEKVRKN